MFCPHLGNGVPLMPWPGTQVTFLPFGLKLAGLVANLGWLGGQSRREALCQVGSPAGWHNQQNFGKPDRKELTRRRHMKLTILKWCSRETDGVVSMKSTLSWTSQWKTLMNVRMVNMATNSTLNSSRKIVIARQVSITAWLMRSLIRSISASRSWPKKICSNSAQPWAWHSGFRCDVCT